MTHDITRILEKEREEKERVRGLLALTILECPLKKEDDGTRIGKTKTRKNRISPDQPAFYRCLTDFPSYFPEKKFEPENTGPNYRCRFYQKLITSYF